MSRLFFQGHFKTHIIAFSGLNREHLAMLPYDEKKIRESLERYIARAGQGAIGELCAIMRISRHWLWSFRQGTSIGGNYVFDLLTFLAQKGYWNDPIVGPADSATLARLNAQEAARERPIAPYAAPSSPSPWTEIADELDALSRALRGSLLDDDAKAERFTYTVATYQAHIEAFLAKRKRLKQTRTE